MVDWPVVAAFIGPLIAAIGLVAGLFAYLNRQREKRVAEQIRIVTNKLEANDALMQQRIDQIESSLAAQSRQLEKQGDSLLAAVQTIARIEGRLLGTNAPPPSVLPTRCEDVIRLLPTGALLGLGCFVERNTKQARRPAEMLANLVWKIEVTCDGRSMGRIIQATGWDVLSKLAAVKAAIPSTWQADAYPEIG